MNFQKAGVAFCSDVRRGRGDFRCKGALFSLLGPMIGFGLCEGPGVLTVVRVFSVQKLFMIHAL